MSDYIACRIDTSLRLIEDGQCREESGRTQVGASGWTSACLNPDAKNNCGDQRWSCCVTSIELRSWARLKRDWVRVTMRSADSGEDGISLRIFRCGRPTTRHCPKDAILSVLGICSKDF
jgi:hypothetical protein